MFSNKKKKIEKRIEEIRKRQIKKVLKEIEPTVELPKEEKFEPYSIDYKKFLEDIKRKPETFYEKACLFSEKLIKVKPDDSTSAKLKQDITAAYITATPEGVMSFSLLSFFAMMLISVTGILGGFINAGFGLFLILLGGGISYFIYTYPSTHARSLQAKMSSEIVLAILYMVIYMRNNPNIEGAVKFASKNLSGPLSWDLKKIMWDVELGTYSSIDEAFSFYLTKWKDKNEEFSEALHILKASTSESESRRTAMLDEAINVILEGTKERMKHYAQGLRLPVMLIHAMGVLLPVIGLIMFPIIVLFMQDVIKPVFIFIGYDIALPVFLYLYMNYILQTKPPTFSQPDTTKSKGIPPIGKFSLFGKNIPILPISLIIGLIIISIGFAGIGTADVATSVNYSIIVVIGICVSVIVYCYLDSYQKIKIRNDIEKIENEFSEALFQLGNSIAGGTPIEVSVDRAVENLKNMKISDLFLISSMNMKKLGMTFEQSLFDKEYGAIQQYPSKLIHSIMQTIIESSRKSVKIASLSMLTISHYLKGMHNVKEEINEILGETVTSMKFLALFLAPMIAGVTVSMAVVIIQILTSISTQLSTLASAPDLAGGLQGLVLFGWNQGGTGPPIEPAAFQLIVGIYMLQTALLLSYFINRIQYGEDAIGLRNVIWQTLIFAAIIYALSWFVTYNMFGGPIKSLLNPIT